MWEYQCLTYLPNLCHSCWSSLNHSCYLSPLMTQICLHVRSAKTSLTWSSWCGQYCNTTDVPAEQNKSVAHGDNFLLDSVTTSTPSMNSYHTVVHSSIIFLSLAPPINVFLERVARIFVIVFKILKSICFWRPREGVEHRCCYWNLLSLAANLSPEYYIPHLMKSSMAAENTFKKQILSVGLYNLENKIKGSDWQ
jgi:hypothetical protein